MKLVLFFFQLLSMDVNQTAADADETLKLFIPIKRLLDSHTGSSDPPMLTKGFISDPILSVDLDSDVIIQTAYIRRSYEEEDDSIPDFILDDVNLPFWSHYEAKTFFHDIATTSTLVPPIELIGSCLGFAEFRPNESQAQESSSLDKFMHLLALFDESPNIAIANILLSRYSSHLELIYQHLKGKTVSMPTSTVLDIINEDPIWNLPVKCISPYLPAQGDLPNALPPEIVSHLNHILSLAQVDSLPMDVFMSAVFHWIPDDDMSLSPLTCWRQEIRQEMIYFYQQRQLNSHPQQRRISLHLIE
jgi:hypothetical protein